jgi:hypothetical protein
MSEPQAAPAVAPAPVAAPPAAPAAAPETFAQKMERLGGFDAPEGDAEAATDAPAAPAEPKAPKKVVQVGSEREAQLKALAKELGFEVESGRVTATERHEFREWKRKQKAAFESELSKRTEEFSGKERTHSERVAKADALEKANEAGDYEAIAKLLGHEDWNKLQESVIARVSDPNYKRLRQLELDAEKRAKADEEQKAQTEAQQKAAQRRQLEGQYMQGLSQTMAKSRDPLLAALHDEPLLYQTIHRIQKENWDGEAVPAPERCINMAVKGSKWTVREELERLASKLTKALHKEPTAPAAPQKKPAPKSAPVPPSAGVEASGPGKWGDKSKKDWFEYQRARLKEAIAKDERDGT